MYRPEPCLKSARPSCRQREASTRRSPAWKNRPASPCSKVRPSRPEAFSAQPSTCAHSSTSHMLLPHPQKKSPIQRKVPHQEAHPTLSKRVSRDKKREPARGAPKSLVPSQF